MPTGDDDDSFFDPFEREAYFKPSQKETIEERLKKRAQSDGIKEMLQSQGWMTTVQASEETGYSKPTLYKWSRDLLAKKSRFVWEHATSHAVLLHPDFIKSKSKVYQKEKTLREQGWITTNAFAAQMDVSLVTYLSYANALITEKSPHIWVNEVTGFRFLSPEYVRRHAEYRTQYLQRIQEGWKTTQELSEIHGMSRGDVTRIVRNLGDNVDAIRMKKPFDKQLLINSEIFSAYGPAKDKQRALEAQGWKTADDIAGVLGVDKKVLFQWAQKSLSEGSSLVWYSELPGKTPVYLFHPDYVRDCESRIDLVAQQLKQQGWKTITELSVATRISHIVLRRKAKELTAAGSEHVRQTLVDGVYYFSPAYVQELRGQGTGPSDISPDGKNTSHGHKREDWHTISEAAVITGLSRSNLKQRAQKISLLDPNSMLVRKEANHYLFHVDYLQAVSRTMTQAINLKQQGWMDSSAAAEATGIIQTRIGDICRKYYDEHGPDNDYVWKSEDTYEWLLSPAYAAQLASIQSRDERLRQEGWITSAQMIEATGLSIAALTNLAKKSVSAGRDEAWQNSLNGHWLYNPDILSSSESKGEIATKDGSLRVKVVTVAEEKELRAAGWRTLQDVTNAAGFAPTTLNKRAAKLIEEGSPHVWQNQASGVWLLHPDYAESLIQINEKEKSLRTAGWKTTAELADLMGAQHGLMVQRVGKMQKAGSDQIWFNGNKGNWLIHPDYVEKAVDTAATERRLVSEGWVAASKLSRTLDVEMGTMARQAKKLADQGSGMAWLNESEYIWYVHPEYAQKLTQSITRERQLEKAGWVSIAALSTAAECTAPQLGARARKMLEQGSADVWFREVGKPYYLFSPSYKDRVIATVSKEKELRRAGWKNVTEMAEAVGMTPSGMSSRVRKLESETENLIWRDEESEVCLIDPSLKERISGTMRIRTGKSEKIGNADPNKLEQDIKARLPRKDKERE